MVMPSAKGAASSSRSSSPSATSRRTSAATKIFVTLPMRKRCSTVSASPVRRSARPAAASTRPSGPTASTTAPGKPVATTASSCSLDRFHLLSRYSHPELVEQHPKVHAVLVVADAPREDVDRLRVDERHPRRLVDGLPVDAFPQSAHGIGVRRLLGRGGGDLPVDPRVAELRGIPVRGAGQDGVVEPGRRRIVGRPVDRSDLRSRAGSRRSWASSASCSAPSIDTRYPSDRRSFTANRPTPG